MIPVNDHLFINASHIRKLVIYRSEDIDDTVPPTTYLVVHVYYGSDDHPDVYRNAEAASILDHLTII